MTVRVGVEALATLLVGTGLLLVARRSLAGHLRRVARRTRTPVDDIVADLVERTHPVTILTASAWVARTFWLPEVTAVGALTLVTSVVMMLQAGVWGGHLVAAIAARRQATAAAAGHAGDATAWSALAVAARVAIWVIVVLVALENVGVDVTALIAGLGIGGLAIGLALQSVLGDVLASLAIVFDRPFVIGDFLVVDEVAGTVEHIGIKTTRVRALSGEQIVISNAELLKSRIRNFQRLSERRNVLSFGVVYETSADVLARIPAIVRQVIEDQVSTRFDRAHLCRFGESSIDFEVAYFLADPDFNHHMDVQQDVLLALVRRFADLGVGFAYPTRTLHVHVPEGASTSAERKRTTLPTEP